MRTLLLVSWWIAASAMFLGCEGVQDQAPGHGMSITVDISAGAEEVSFLSPMVSAQTMAIGELVGKPVYVAFFEGGVNAGVDLPIYETWLEVPEDLSFDVSCPVGVESGPYDAVVIIYRNTPIGAPERATLFPPIPCCGDLAAFTLSEFSVRPGDPEVTAGVIRIHVDDADGDVLVTNRVPTDFEDNEQIANAFTDTILVLP